MSVSSAQLERRRVVVDLAISLASAGGYEAVQMRRISEETGVALDTLYSWFEFTDLLLLEVMVRWMTDVCSELRLRPVTGTTAAERVNVRLE